MLLDDSLSLPVLALGEKGSHEIICGIAHISILPQAVFKYALGLFEFPLFYSEYPRLFRVFSPTGRAPSDFR